jgi:Ferric reductase like transmembrane component
MSGPLPWYVARAAGLVAWALLSASVLWGLTLSTKVLGRRPRPNWLLDLHRWLGGAALIFTGVHIGALLADQYVRFTPTDVLVPFASHWHPMIVAWGIVAFDLLLAVELTSLARAHLPKTLWRRVHYASFPLFAIATIHGLTASSDTQSIAARLIAMSVVTMIAGLTVVRIIGETDQRRGSGRAAPGRVPVMVDGKVAARR